METFDVAVIGGGTAGVPAAVQAGRCGARTLLVEQGARFGGTLTNAGVVLPGLFHAWGRQVIAGIGWELVAAAVEESGERLPDFTDLTLRHWRHQPRVNPTVHAALCDEFVLEAGVEPRLFTMLARLRRSEDDAGWRLTLCGKEGLEDIAARVVVDCSGDATAAFLAGAGMRRPDPCQPATLSCQVSGYDPETVDLPALDRAFAAAVAEGILRAEDACWHNDRPSVSGWLRKFGNNAGHVPATPEAHTSVGRTRLEIEARRGLRRLVRWLRQQPGLENLRIDFCYPETGLRETVTVIGCETVTLDDYRGGRAWPDAVCYSFYPIDIHGLTSGEWHKQSLEPGVVPSVPRGALAVAGRTDLLVAGRILSSDRGANSALRVQATCMATGQASGAWAALAAARGCSTANVPMEDLRAVLRRHGAIVPGD